MHVFSTINVDSNHWAMLTFGNMSEVARTRADGTHERTFYDRPDDAATVYLGIVSDMFTGTERLDELEGAMCDISESLDAENVPHDWTGASPAEVHAGDAPCLVIYEDED